MPNITKKQLMIYALSKYSTKKIDEAVGFTYIVTFQNWTSEWPSFFSLTHNIKWGKKGYIFKKIRSWLLNRKATESNKRLGGDTSSGNIIGISVILKLK